MATDPWGIEDRFHDAFGVERITGDETRAEILRAMGLDPKAPALPDPTATRVIRSGAPATLGSGGELLLEDGARLILDAGGALPGDVPTGYHTFVPRGPGPQGPGTRDHSNDHPVQVIVAPRTCYLPDDLKTWGWAIQLYATRSRASWGIGDLGDLRELCAWTGGLGGGAVMINPLSAPAPVFPVEASPYYPSSRRFRNPLYLRIEDIPGAATHPRAEIDSLANEARALNADRRIERNRVMALKMRALEILWGRFGGDAAFEAYRRREGAPLDEFAAYCVLAERHGKDWRRWPADARHPAHPDVRRLITDDRRVVFHEWVQWLLDEQLGQAAAAGVKIINDMPVGFDIAGADGWCWQDLVAEDISIGCPPDGFNLDGQDWGLAPFIPTKLRAAGYAPFIQTIRSLLRHAGGVRIDHVMGLFRLFWIPRALGNRGGSYVGYPADELLAIVALESQRARATIVGEDLGTVLPGTREILAAHRLLSYRLLFFEPDPPPKFPELALCSVTTHDLATIAGIWTGDAVAHALSAGVTPNTEGLTALKEKLAVLAGEVTIAGAKDATPVEDNPGAAAPATPWSAATAASATPGGLDDVIVAIHRALGTAPCRILLATLDDALGVLEQPNMPGTTTSWPNWSLALPRTIEEIREADLPKRIAAVMRRG